MSVGRFLFVANGGRRARGHCGQTDLGYIDKAAEQARGSKSRSSVLFLVSASMLVYNLQMLGRSQPYPLQVAFSLGVYHSNRKH